MTVQQVEFANRLSRLIRKHQAMTRGYTTSMRPDGLIVAKPRRAPAPISGRSVLIFLAAFLMFKVVLMASLGSEAYDTRVARLQEGTLVEKAGAFAMQGDPLTRLVAETVAPVLR
ncbi:hypothetical protein CVM52_23010 [Pseudooceanicola lipolyticus]|uniref:Uncharacterized protein n=1 Tax=Pseudooceanicola lipolyticus TaxID=2029104 RepID=A0A2M8IUU1_9RHOB|nr:hypothetical protein [Pseudooceanicola lipolyticus]PJE34300.1 hypothetical protein CVM52_23010 [Pseudooceanicola lipolyticus]